MAIKIVVADDQTIVREGLKKLLEGQSDMQVVAQAGDSVELARVVKDTSPDVVITDVMMNNLDGAETIRNIVAENPNTRVVALSNHLNSRHVVGMLSAGACAYLLKDCSFAELARAIRTVASGRTYLSPSVSDIVVNSHFHNPGGVLSPAELLSARERQVLQLVADGRSTKEIAAKYFISKKTVETHRMHLMQKLNAGSVAELVKYAIREGLTDLEK